MLVLTRKQQEKIRIGNEITITVLKTKGKAVRLGIEAPAEVPVIRGELKFEDQAGVVGEDGVPASVAESASPPETSKRGLPQWPAKSAPVAREVHFKRVPRAGVSEMLPRLSSGEGPLRAMLDRRTLSA